MPQVISPDHPLNWQQGEEFETIQIIATREMVNFFLIGINNRDSWFVEKSPLGSAIVPGTMVHSFNIRSRAYRVWHDFAGALFTEPAGMHVGFEAEFFDPIRVGEKITIKGKVTAVNLKRDRKFIETQTEVYGEDDRLCNRYISTNTFLTPKEES